MAFALNAQSQKGPTIDMVVQIANQKLDPAYYSMLPYQKRTDRQGNLLIQARVRFDRLVEVGKTDQPPISQIQTPFTKTINYRYFRRQFQTLREDMGNDINGLISMGQIGSDMAVAERHIMELTHAEPYNNATSATGRFAGLDGVALLSNSHPTADGGTQGNFGLVIAGTPTQVDLSATNLQDAIQHLKNTNDYRGMPIAGMKDFVLIYPTELDSIAQTILGSDKIPSAGNINGAFQRGTADLAAANYNDVNWGRKVVTGIEHPYLVDTDGWFLAARSHWDGPLEWMRQAPRRYQVEDPHGITWAYASELMMGVVPTDWVGLWGTTGE